MKLTIIITLICICPTIWAQDSNILVSQLWGMQESYAINEENNVRADFYNVNATENIEDFTGFEYDFQGIGTLNIKVNDTISEDKAWAFFSAGDSLSISDARYKLVILTANEIVLRATIEEFNHPFDYYYKLAPLASLSNEKFNFNRYVEIHPNPTTDFLNLRFDNMVSSNLKEIAIINITGNYVMTSKLDNSNLQKVSVSNLANGIYFIKIIDKFNRTIAVKKFVVQK